MTVKNKKEPLEGKLLRNWHHNLLLVITEDNLLITAHLTLNKRIFLAICSPEHAFHQSVDNNSGPNDAFWVVY